MTDEMTMHACSQVLMVMYSKVLRVKMVVSSHTTLSPCGIVISPRRSMSGTVSSQYLGLKMRLAVKQNITPTDRHSYSAVVPSNQALPPVTSKMLPFTYFASSLECKKS